MKMNTQEYLLAKACFNDNFDDVKALLNEFPKIELNDGQDGTPLILTGSSKIGQLLLESGAEINCVFNRIDVKITALDSAKKTYEQMVKSNDSKKTMLKEYIDFLEKKDAKTYEELPEEKK